MTSIKPLDEDRQISNDFLLGYDSDTGNYIAVRSPNEECHFYITNKNYWLCVTEALEIFHNYILNQAVTELRGSWDNNKREVVWQ